MDYFKRLLRAVPGKSSGLLRFPKRGRRQSAVQSDVDQQLVRSLSRSRIPTWGQFKYIGRFLSNREKAIIGGAGVIFVASALVVLASAYRANVVEVPARGGAYTESLTGSPSLINPLYASLNTVDRDLTALMFSGLLRHNNRGAIVPDLAEHFTVADDKKTYTFTLRTDAVWHDGQPVTADDVIFTFSAITNPAYQSPLRGQFANVAVSKADESTVVFSLAEANPAFIDSLTVGILPAHLWRAVPVESAFLSGLNVKPVGSGPFKFKSFAKDDMTGILKVYELEAFEDYFGETPRLAELVFRFNPTFEESVNALNEDRVNGIDYLPPTLRDTIIAKKSYRFRYLPQPQVSAVFFNQSDLGMLTDVRVRKALALATDNEALVAEMPSLLPLETPFGPLAAERFTAESPYRTADTAAARALLTEAGWALTAAEETASTSEAVPAGEWYKKGDEWLRVTLTTVNQPESVQAAEALAGQWRALNVITTVSTVEPELIQADVIQPRAYQALLYGYITGTNPDPYPFWHSSQAGAEGLNLANFENDAADTLLEEARAVTDDNARAEKWAAFQKTVFDTVPAVFLYSQAYPYIQSNRLNGFDVTAVVEPADRFSNVTEWYVRTKKRLKFLQ